MGKKIYVPPIKSQGIKTKLVPWIKSVIPAPFNNTWIEPFMGTGVVAFNIVPKVTILCDTNPHLINFYKALQNKKVTPAIAKRFLQKEGELLLTKGEEHYYSIRERFNKEHNPLDFLFLNRSCFNGMIRFNRKGGFNVPFCRKPERFAQAYVTKIVNQLEYVFFLLQFNDFEFRCQDFNDTIALGKEGDIIYCDPPYIGRHTDYFNGWDDEKENELFHALNSTKASFILSTWHNNDYRKNDYIENLWAKFPILTRNHFYHVGGRVSNRNPMVEALITNYNAEPIEYEQERIEQLKLFEKIAEYKSEVLVE
ncbi:MAG: Dam family site-specific DNA-(adenine-N6)-methyltransferase [Candidatus Muirbacterium halophilum]|nr:Dam family site-specific DNA-(adenine-N6)-methyltransferase [Candidatus Muirbacterium halophilum]MCK9474864.1 Dam family site-specific DNA-(adenine-N6)-methyltransferase [Candidatus Muirbacterium halophilum]